MVNKARSRPGLIFRGSGNTSNSGGGVAPNGFFTNDANSNRYFTDDANANRYSTSGNYGAGTALSLPPNFTARWSPPFTVYENGRVYYTDLNFDAIKPSGLTYYVSKAGNDTTGDGSSGNPYRTLTKAYTQGAVVIMVRAGIYDRSDLTASLNPNRSIMIVSADGAGKAVISRIQAGTLVWTQQSSPNTDVYSTPAIASARTVLDMNYAYSGEYLMDGTTPLPQPYTNVADIAACQALPASWVIVGGVMYVHTFDNRAPDTNVKVLRVEANLQPATADTTFCLDGMEMWGDDSVRFIVTAPSTNSVLLCRNTAARYGGVNLANAFRANGINFSYAINCECTDYLGNGDGFNYHGDSGNGVSVNFLEWDCKSRRIGVSTQSNNNATTSHENCAGIRLNGRYELSWGPVSADVKAVGTLGAVTLNLGGTYGNSYLTNNSGQDAAIQAGETGVEVYAKNVTTFGANYGLYGSSGGVVRNWGGQIDTTTLGNGGTVTNYP